MRSSIALSVAALASLSAAQTTPQNDYPYTIDPNSVSSSDKGVFRDKTHFMIETNMVQPPGARTKGLNARSSACNSPASPP
jgi:hypothetical protein